MGGLLDGGCGGNNVRLTQSSRAEAGTELSKMIYIHFVIFIYIR